MAILLHATYAGYIQISVIDGIVFDFSEWKSWPIILVSTKLHHIILSF